jgi:hypothetical protein
MVETPRRNTFSRRAERPPRSRVPHQRPVLLSTCSRVLKKFAGMAGWTRTERANRTQRPVVPFSFLRCSGAFELTAYPKTQLYNLQRGGPAGTPLGASLSRRARTCSGCDHRQRQSASSNPPAKLQENHIIEGRFHTALYEDFHVKCYCNSMSFIVRGSV